MRAVRYHEAGDPDVLRVEELDRPDPVRDEVLVEVRAASVNPVDAKFRASGLPWLPKTTGSDLAGVVVDVGATPVATARPEHHGAVRALGAETVLDYRRDDLAAAAREATGGAAVVLDHMPDAYFGTDVEVAAFGSSVVVIAGESATLPDVTTARSKELDLHMMSMSNLATHPEMPDIGPILTRLGRLLAEGRLDVTVDRTYPLADAAEAHRAVMEESFVGKIVVRP